jgi:transporter family-2 protein
MPSWGYVVLTLLAGVCIAFQGPINASLRIHVGALESALVSFCVGTVLLAVLVFLGGKGSLAGLRSVQAWELLGGLIGALYVTVTLLAAPAIGVTGMIVAGLAGQILMALAIDAFGLVGLPKKPLDLPRLAGLVLLVAAMLLINWNSWKKPA